MSKENWHKAKLDMHIFIFKISDLNDRSLKVLEEAYPSILSVSLKLIMSRTDLAMGTF